MNHVVSHLTAHTHCDFNVVKCWSTVKLGVKQETNLAMAINVLFLVYSFSSFQSFGGSGGGGGSKSCGYLIIIINFLTYVLNFPADGKPVSPLAAVVWMCFSHVLVMSLHSQDHLLLSISQLQGVRGKHRPWMCPYSVGLFGDLVFSIQDFRLSDPGSTTGHVHGLVFLSKSLLITFVVPTGLHPVV